MSCLVSCEQRGQKKGGLCPRSCGDNAQVRGTTVFEDCLGELMTNITRAVTCSKEGTFV